MSATGTLTLVPDTQTAATGAAVEGFVDHRPPLQRVCAGQPMLLTDDEVDLVALVNTADEVIDTLLDLDADPDDYRLAEVLIEHLCRRYGVERHADGDRVTGVETVLRRHLIPFLIEADEARPPGRCGVGALRITHLERLPQVLAGDRQLPAATVAGDHLGRRGAACLYLSLTDAAQVSHDGRDALDAAVASGAVPVRTDVRTGAPIVMALDLRRAGLLIERDRPHGVKQTTARNILRDLKLAIERARMHGANVRGTFRLTAIEPLPQHLARPPKTGRRQITLVETAALAGHLSVIGQVLLWVGRLVGTRIGEEFGLLVCDYFRDGDGQPWLDFSKQGGRACLVRDPATGRLVPQDRKPRTKTPKGMRCIPIPRPLGDLLDRLIAAFHTDPDTGYVDYEARLIPGIGKNDASGQSTFRTALTAATKALGLATTPHDLRDCLITDLRNAGIDERVRHFYAGHEVENPTIQDQHYDLGVAPDLLIAVADLLTAKIETDLGTSDLRVPTAAGHQWGKDTVGHARRTHIDHVLETTGWTAVAVGAHGQGRKLTVKQVAERIDLHPTGARALMRKGTIRAHQEPWGTRPVWVAYEADVEAYLASLTGVRIDDLAAETGWTYHQVRDALLGLGLIPADHVKGRPVRLSAEAAAAFRAEAARRTRVAEHAVPIAQAAHILGIPVVSVETLLRQGLLEKTDGPTDARGRWVTVASVQDYQARFPAPDETPNGDEVPVLTNSETRRILGLTRPRLTLLTTTRQLALAKRTGSRHVYVTVISARRYAERTGQDRAVDELDRLERVSAGLQGNPR